MDSWSGVSGLSTFGRLVSYDLGRVSKPLGFVRWRKLRRKLFHASGLCAVPISAVPVKPVSVSFAQVILCTRAYCAYVQNVVA